MADAQGAGADSGNGWLRRGAVLGPLAWGLCSDPGGSREHNEDYAAAYAPTTPEDVWERGPLFVVADGMGGHAAGEVASRVSVDAAIETWSGGSAPNPLSAVRNAARAANTAVIDAAREPGRTGMGSTIVAAALQGTEAVVGHVGDSRCYLVRHDECTQLTTDHSRVAEMLRMHLITPEQAARHPARSQLTRSLGADMFVKPDVAKHPIERHDVLILCSDGVWDVLGRAELATIGGAIASGDVATPVDAAAEIVETAIKEGSTDNVTALVVHVTVDRPIAARVGGRRLFGRRRR
jgi:serine/threonine protein phosphatase PrpC